jgi:hypothetical protein
MRPTRKERPPAGLARSKRRAQEPGEETVKRLQPLCPGFGIIPTECWRAGNSSARTWICLLSP